MPRSFVFMRLSVDYQHEQQAEHLGTEKQLTAKDQM